MIKYAKIENEITKEVSVGLGNPKDFYGTETRVRTNERGEEETYDVDLTIADFYESIGMVEMDVEQGWDRSWYLAGFAPQKPLEELAKEKRTERDALLESTDKYMISDYPITEEERERYKAYRQYLRDLPESAGFPNVEIKTFNEYKGAKNEKKP